MLSLSTAMQTNLGMAIELALKRVVYVNGYSKCINEHELNGIYKLLSCEVKTVLEKIYLDYSSTVDMQVFIIRPAGVKHDPQKVLGGRTFQDLLRFLDDHDLYGKRYSFETFDIKEPQYIIHPNYFNGFIYTINGNW